MSFDPLIQLPEKRITWFAENELWFLMHHTCQYGRFQEEDMKRFSSATGKFICHADHKDPQKPRDFIEFMIGNFATFISGKVSKFARDNELCVVLLSIERPSVADVQHFSKQFNVLCWRYENDLNAKTPFDIGAQQLKGLRSTLQLGILNRELQ